MDSTSATTIHSWHAHVYFDAACRDAAWQLRQRAALELAGLMELGRFHEKPVGPHPMWSYQLAISNPHFAQVIGWLAVHRGGLDVFVHPNTDDELTDHRDRAIWMGHVHTLDLRGLGN